MSTELSWTLQNLKRENLTTYRLTQTRDEMMILSIKMRFERKEIDQNFEYNEYRISDLVQMISIEQNVWFCRWQHIVKKMKNDMQKNDWLKWTISKRKKITSDDWISFRQYSNVFMQNFSILISFFSSLEIESLRLKIFFF